MHPNRTLRVYMITLQDAQTKYCVVAHNHEEAITALKVARDRSEIFLSISGLVEIAKVDAVQQEMLPNA